MRDVARSEIHSCKFRPELLTCKASSHSDQARRDVEVTFSDDTSLNSNEPAIDQRLSELVGYQSTLEPLKPLTELDFYRRHKRDADS
ncbi:MAG: hypothetical protein ACI9QV_000015 [Methylophagaceae bacterium]